MDEIPDRSMMDPEAALGGFGDKPMPGPRKLKPFALVFQQPSAVLARDGLRL
jgi:hypothetical protein